MKVRNYKIKSKQRCSYEGCYETPTAIYHNRMVCSLHYDVIKREARLKRIKEKQNE